MASALTLSATARFGGTIALGVVLWGLVLWAAA